MINRETKAKQIETLKNDINEHDCFYAIGLGNMDVEKNMMLRRLCREKGIYVKVVKNSLISICLKELNNEQYNKIDTSCLVNTSALLFVNKAYSVPGKLLNNFKKKVFDGVSLKFAYANGDIYYGEDGLKKVSSLKTLEELLSDIALSIQLVINDLTSALGNVGKGSNENVAK